MVVATATFSTIPSPNPKQFSLFILFLTLVPLYQPQRTVANNQYNTLNEKAAT